MDDHLRRSVRAAITRHLELHPDASDTPEGISGFWLSTQQVKASVSLVEAVLEEMVLDGILRMRGLPDGGVIFAARRVE